MEPRKPGALEQIAALTSALAMAWMMMPPQERYWCKLRTLALLHRASERLARKAGHRAMGDELAGRDYQRYVVALRLSQARDAIGRTLEGMRP